MMPPTATLDDEAVALALQRELELEAQRELEEQERMARELQAALAEEEAQASRACAEAAEKESLRLAEELSRELNSPKPEVLAQEVERLAEQEAFARQLEAELNAPPAEDQLSLKVAQELDAELNAAHNAMPAAAPAPLSLAVPLETGAGMLAAGAADGQCDERQVEADMDLVALEELREELERQKDECIAREMHQALNGEHESLERADEQLARALQEAYARECSPRSGPRLGAGRSFASALKGSPNGNGSEPGVARAAWRTASEASAAASLGDSATGAAAAALDTKSVGEVVRELRDYADTPISEARRLRKQSFALLGTLQSVDAAIRQKRKHQAEVLNTQAAGIVFAHLNRQLGDVMIRYQHRQSPRRINHLKVDLHYLLVAEAVARLGAVLQFAAHHHCAQLEVICGVGNHSANGRARIAPSVRALLRRCAARRDRVRRFNERKPGVFIVELLH